MIRILDSAFAWAYIGIILVIVVVLVIVTGIIDLVRARFGYPPLEF